MYIMQKKCIDIKELFSMKLKWGLNDNIIMLLKNFIQITSR